ncbi:MAG: tRNA1(Val) (adenine(37)-N6)-methyltransferase [Janthinobacterium lividum]
MPHDYFQFKQFRIEQADCAQKVSTDACVLGAVADLTSATRILDIGTGTGLLALMAAQRALTAHIETLEIEPAAAAQAAANVAASPWPGRIRVWPLSLADYAATRPAPFSHLICNPPFFRRSLPPPDAARATARHAGETSLTFDEIGAFAAEFLAPGGTLTVLLPPPEMAHFVAAAAACGLVLQARLRVRHRPGGRTTREIGQFGREAGRALRETELVIQKESGDYSADFRALLAGFYLAL